MPFKDTFNKLKGLVLFAADGAGLKLYDMGITPDYIIGDLDSIDTYQKDSIINSGSYLNSKVIFKPSQETNDFEKNLVFAKSLGYKNLLIMGFHGGELEHTLNNWSVFRKFSYKLNLCIYDTGRYGISINKSTKLIVKKGELISLIPQSKVKLTTNGLHWELKEETLELGIREGARNIAKNEEISLTIIKGELILFFDERLPFSPFIENNSI